jgi:isopentenyl-diphosphate delta-isomerase
MTEERVILVDEADREVGVEEKLRAHERGVLHRAFSIFLFDPHNRLLIQRRAASKYHSPGLWSNTCCGHPRPGEGVANAAGRRLSEEMGVSPTIEERFAFTYTAKLDRGLTEHEYDHVFLGRFDGQPSPDGDEVGAWGWIEIDRLLKDCVAMPQRYSAWLPIALQEIVARGLFL